LSVRDAEFIISANSNVRNLAESGELAKIHSKFDALENRVEGDYLAARNHIGKILIQIEDKEDELVQQLQEMGIEKLRIHTNGNWEKISFFDRMGLTYGDPSINNITVLEAAIERGHD
jgi:uncharacterized protein with NAD-binding domain and iron-sulfur cluster